MRLALAALLAALLLPSLAAAAPEQSWDETARKACAAFGYAPASEQYAGCVGELMTMLGDLNKIDR
jgi:hypothetical protein